MRRWVELVLVVLVLGVTITLAVSLAEDASAHTEPPALGYGDWTVRDQTVIRDWELLMLRGNIHVTDGGNLTLVNSTVLFVNSAAGEHGIVVDGGGTLRILDGTIVGSYRPLVTWTFVVEAGCHLEIRDALIDECGMAAFGIRPAWRQISLYIGTSDATVENTTFTGGLVGPYFPEGVIAPPVRNCTFDNAYGVVSHGTAVEDCTFRDQSLFGVVFMGGTEGRISRCTFEEVASTCLQVGYEFFEPYELHVAQAVIEDCTFRKSSRAIRVVISSQARIVNCSTDLMEREALYVMSDARVDLRNGVITNTPLALFSEAGSNLTWTIDTKAMVLRGNLTMTGDIILADGAELELLEFRDLNMLSNSTRRLEIRLGSDAILTLANGSIRTPGPWAIPESWYPARLVGPSARVEMRGMERIDLTYPVVLQRLKAIDCRMSLGEWNVTVLHLEDCELVKAQGSGPSTLRFGRRFDVSTLIRCRLVGFSDTSGLLEVTGGEVRSIDFLHDLDELKADGTLKFRTIMFSTRVNAYWSFETHVHWQNQLPVVGAEVLVDHGDGENISWTTDDGGDTPVEVLLTEWLTSGMFEKYLPLTFSTNVSGVTGSATVAKVREPQLVDITVLDLVRPILVVDQGSSVALNRSSLNITGQVTDEHSGVAFLEIALLPADYFRVPIDQATGRFTVSFDLRLGYQTISLRGYDKVGNRVTRKVEAFYSLLPPYVWIDSPEEGDWVNSSVVMVTGQTDMNSTVEAQGRLTQATNGTFRVPVILREGPNLVVVNVTNPAGNHNTTSVMVYLDTRPPSLTILNPSESPHYTSAERVEIRGLVEAGAEVFINSVTVRVEDDGSFIKYPALDQGAKRYLITARDRAGNTFTQELVIVLDSLPPSMVVVVVDGRDAVQYTDEGLLRTSAASVTIQVTLDEVANLKIGGQDVALVDMTGTSKHALQEGLNTIIVHAEDEAGNWVEFGPIRVEVDRTPPDLQVHELPDRSEEALLTIRGATEPNVTLYINGARITVAVRGEFVRNFLLNEGLNVMVFEAHDRYGQVTRLTMEVDMSPPQPEPLPSRPSVLPQMLAITLAILAVQALILHLWWRRQKRIEAGAREVLEASHQQWEEIEPHHPPR